MSLQRRDVFVVVLLLVVFLGVFTVLFLRSGGGGGKNPGSESRPERISEAGHDVKNDVPGRRTVSSPRETGEETSEKSSSSGTASSASSGKSSSSSASSSGNGSGWKARPVVEFTEEDTRLFGRGVTVDLGDYQPRVGEEFDVTLTLTAPALESCTLVLAYDPSALAIVPGSAMPVGRGFRAGIECYADEGSGRLVLIQKGIPGSKNLDATSEEPVAVWRMRALREGSTEIGVETATSFENGRGESEKFTVSGGSVVVK